jgi:hypothetical protein
MAHPLEINLSELTDDELNDRISDLYARVKFFGPNGNANFLGQIYMLIEEATNEQVLRSERQMGGYDKNK